MQRGSVTCSLLHSKKVLSQTAWLPGSSSKPSCQTAEQICHSICPASSPLSLPFLSPWAQLGGAGHCADGDEISRTGWVFRRTEAEAGEGLGSFG